MKRLSKLLAVLSLSFISVASQHQQISALGASPKGQYVALEEYGYNSLEHSYYVKVRILNMLTQDYEGAPLEVKAPANRGKGLSEARMKARIAARVLLAKYQIRSI